MAQNTDWFIEGACNGVDPMELPARFVPPHEALEEALVTLLTAEFCGRCVVKQQCLDYALSHRNLVGIWGGTTTSERRRILRHSA